MGIGINLYQEYFDNEIKSSIEIGHKRPFENGCGYINKYETNSSEFKTAMDNGYFVCQSCKESLFFKIRETKQITLWLNQTKESV